jgi:hypothetical protein
MFVPVAANIIDTWLNWIQDLNICQVFDTRNITDKWLNLIRLLDICQVFDTSTCVDLSLGITVKVLFSQVLPPVLVQ